MAPALIRTRSAWRISNSVAPPRTATRRRAHLGHERRSRQLATSARATAARADLTAADDPEERRANDLAPPPAIRVSHGSGLLEKVRTRCPDGTGDPSPPPAAQAARHAGNLSAGAIDGSEQDRSSSVSVERGPTSFDVASAARPSAPLDTESRSRDPEGVAQAHVADVGLVDGV